jgi:hypothetical protein
MTLRIQGLSAFFKVFILYIDGRCEENNLCLLLNDCCGLVAYTVSAVVKSILLAESVKSSSRIHRSVTGG